jgi:integrase
MPKRRGNNEGSVSKTKSGRWRAQVTLQGRRVSHTADTQREAQEWIRTLRGQIDQGLSYKGVISTVGEFVEAFIENKRDGLKLSTYQQYKDFVRLYIQPRLGECRFKDLTPERIQAFYNELRAREIGKRTIQITHTVLRSALDQAVIQGLIHHNPADKTQRPKLKRREMDYWDESQVSQFLASIRGKRNEHLYALTIAAGLRLGEVTALKWGDIDWTPGQESIKIQRAIVWKTGGGFLMDAPKTTYGLRSIEIGADMVRRLRQQLELVEALRAAAGEKWQENSLVFPSRVGTPQTRALIDKEFARYNESAGLPDIRYHDLRHTFVALMLNLGVDIYKISRMLGHATAGFTLTRYGHLIPDRERRAAAYMDTITASAPVSDE